MASLDQILGQTDGIRPSGRVDEGYDLDGQVADVAATVEEVRGQAGSPVPLSLSSFSIREGASAASSSSSASASSVLAGPVDERVNPLSDLKREIEALLAQESPDQEGIRAALKTLASFSIEETAPLAVRELYAETKALASKFPASGEAVATLAKANGLIYRAQTHLGLLTDQVKFIEMHETTSALITEISGLIEPLRTLTAKGANLQVQADADKILDSLRTLVGQLREKAQAAAPKESDA